MKFKLSASGRGNGQVVEIHNADGKVVARIFGSTDAITISSEAFLGNGTQAGPFTNSVRFEHGGAGGKKKAKSAPFVTISFAK